MCYMPKSDPKVGVRELRQNLSKYLRRVVRGETLEVTERGTPVAILAPLPEPTGTVDKLVAAGKASAPKGSLLELLPPRGKPSRKLSEALEELREERL
ncbi:MAG: type II toxin-antitoxin system prevent-host-death family antitoxin [Actinomycetota bacterium]